MYNFKGFTQKANTALNLSITCAQDMGHTYVGTEHILLGLLKENTGVAAVVLSDCGLDDITLYNHIADSIGKGAQTVLTADDFTPRTKRVMQMAVLNSARMGHNFVGTEHLLVSILSESDSYAVRFLNELNVNISSIVASLKASLNEDNPQDSADIGATHQKDSSKNKGTKTLSQYGVDLTQKAIEGAIDPVIGRDKEIE